MSGHWLDTYLVAHICTCPKCAADGRLGVLWSHSQSDWDEHLRTVDQGHLISVQTRNLSRNEGERQQQVDRFIRLHRRG